MLSGCEVRQFPAGRKALVLLRSRAMQCPRTEHGLWSELKCISRGRDHAQERQTSFRAGTVSPPASCLLEDLRYPGKPAVLQIPDTLASRPLRIPAVPDPAAFISDTAAPKHPGTSLRAHPLLAELPLTPDPLPHLLPEPLAPPVPCRASSTTTAGLVISPKKNVRTGRSHTDRSQQISRRPAYLRLRAQETGASSGSPTLNP